MPTSLVPLLVAVVLPAGWLLWRAGWLGARATRWVLGLAALSLCVVAWPWGGVDFAYVKRLNLFLAAAAVAIVWAARRRGIDAAAGRARRLAWLGVLAVGAVVVHLNFFAFHGHGSRVWMHAHDVAHYYLGSKYFAELGHTRLYTAVLRAEAESGAPLRTRTARDLESRELVTVRELLARSGEVKARFSEERWRDFRADAELMRRRLGDHYPAFLVDHGYNPTPVWTLIGGTLANRVPAGSERGVFLLTLLDPILLLVLFVLAWRAYGAEAALLAVILWAVLFGATFGWVGGAFLRTPWLVALLGGLCLLRLRRPGAAGALVGLSAALRVFPVLFVVPFALAILAGLAQRRPVPGRRWRFVAGFALSLALWFAASAVAPATGLRAWRQFAANISAHHETPAPNVVGLSRLLTYSGTPRVLPLDEARALWRRHASIQRAVSWVVVPLALVATLLVARRARDQELFLLGVPLAFASLALAAYYWTILVAVPLVRRRRPDDVALVFAVEAASYALLLFEERDAVLFFWRSVLVLWLLVALWLAPRASALRRRSATGTPRQEIGSAG